MKVNKLIEKLQDLDQTTEIFGLRLDDAYLEEPRIETHTPESFAEQFCQDYVVSRNTGKEEPLPKKFQIID